MRDVKQNEFRQVTTFVLSEVVDEFLETESIDTTYHFSCGLESDGKTFTWGEDDRTIKISSFRDFNEMRKSVFYDLLHQVHFSYLEKIDSLYRQRLGEKGIRDCPVVMVWDGSSGRILMTTDTLPRFKGRLFTSSVSVGHECRHQVVASFQEPFIFRTIVWHLIRESVFLLGFILCLLWQWRILRLTLQSAKVQTMGIVHLEHELKKPLAVMISAVGGIIGRRNGELTEGQERRLRLVKIRLLKLADVTDTMLTALKTSKLEIVREPIDIREEMEVVAELFRELCSFAQVEFRIEEGIGRPLLDRVYFSDVVINLVDNAIKYGGNHPEVKVWFGEEGENWVLTVTDKGIGMPARALKRIFRQFYRVKDKRVAAKTGFGLGLSFVKKVVKAYGGKIEVESELGKGSKVRISIRKSG